jgi:hypothetical protein
MAINKKILHKKYFILFERKEVKQEYKLVTFKLLSPKTQSHTQATIPLPFAGVGRS